jgi:hypothetical protein
MVNTKNDRDRLISQLLESEQEFKCVFYADINVMSIRISVCEDVGNRVDFNLYCLPCTTLFLEHGDNSRIWFKYEWWFDHSGNHIGTILNTKEQK